MQHARTVGGATRFKVIAERNVITDPDKTTRVPARNFPPWGPGQLQTFLVSENAGFKDSGAKNPFQAAKAHAWAATTDAAAANAAAAAAATGKVKNAPRAAPPPPPAVKPSSQAWPAVPPHAGPGEAYIEDSGHGRGAADLKTETPRPAVGMGLQLQYQGEDGRLVKLGVSRESAAELPPQRNQRGARKLRVGVSRQSGKVSGESRMRLGVSRETNAEALRPQGLRVERTIHPHQGGGGGGGCEGGGGQNQEMQGDDWSATAEATTATGGGRVDWRRLTSWYELEISHLLQQRAASDFDWLFLS